MSTICKAADITAAQLEVLDRLDAGLPVKGPALAACKRRSWADYNHVTRMHYLTELGREARRRVRRRGTS